MRRATAIGLTIVFFRRISIHALHEESDRFHNLRDETVQAISIHALHEESDNGTDTWSRAVNDFNPRSP